MRNKIITSLALLSSSILTWAAGKSNQPNFVIFIADDLGWEDTTPYGNKVVKTPNIERLAELGRRYDNVFLTASSSSPSRCSILTSLYPHSTGAQNLQMPLPKDKELVATPLREIGYYTMAIGKWHLGNNVKNQFDLVVDTGDKMRWTRGDDWVKALKDRPKNKPFFFYAASNDPHRPYTDDLEKVHNPDLAIVPPYLPNVKDMREDLTDYYNAISRFDKHVGMALAELEKEGVLDNTVIIIMSDNGKPFPQCKTRTNVQGMKTPFIISYPKLIKPGTSSNALISSIDLMPTILDMVGTKYKSKVHGISFKNILSDPNAKFRNYAYAEHNWHDFMGFERSVYTDKYAFTINFLPELPGTPPLDCLESKGYRAMQALYREGELPPDQSDCFIMPRPSEELFDYSIDINCMKNLAFDSQYSKIVSKLKSLVIENMKNTNDGFHGKEKLKKDGFDRNTGENVKKSK